MSVLKTNKSSGFSLLELVTVLLIITVLSTIAIRSTVDIGYSVRFEQTRDRLESIRKAIVGDPKRSINGQPDISGFVADMGRLPINVHELIEEDFCITDRTVVNQPTCEALNAGTGIWNNQPAYTTDSSTNLSYGWRGPYLNISNDPTATDAYTDGWGREAQGYCSTNSDTSTLPADCPDVTEVEWVNAISDHNYGWYFQEDSSVQGDLFLISYGKDQISGGSEYDEDYPTLKPIVKRDWLVDISDGIQVTFTAPIGINTGNRIACIQAGGTWKNSCVINESKCTTTNTTITNPALLGQWVSDSANSFDFCKMREGGASNYCKGERGSENRTGSWKTCHFLSKQSCLLARGEWREKYSENTDSTCNEVTIANDCDQFTRQECEGGAGVFENGKCFICDITDQNLCTASGGIAAGTYPVNGIECKTNGGNWDTATSLCMGANFCEFNDSQQCRDIGGNWSEACQFDYEVCTDNSSGGIAVAWNAAQGKCSTELPAQLLFQASEATYNLQDIVMEITYRDDGGLKVAQSSNAVVQENGKSQTVLFSNFNLYDNTGTLVAAVNDIPIGISSILIAKNYDLANDVGDIYPASCEGLDGDTDGDMNTDCKEAGGTLLNSGLCDNITISECKTGADGTTGRLIRNVLKIPVIPRKNIALISW